MFILTIYGLVNSLAIVKQIPIGQTHFMESKKQNSKWILKKSVNSATHSCLT